MVNTKIPVELDDSVKNNNIFKEVTEVIIDKPTIFKYGILNEQVPKKIKEKEFEYLEGKIPFLAGLNEDFIEIENEKIINLASEEKARTISEIIGVGVGLYYTSLLFKVNPNQFSKIERPTTQGKYMDFKFTNKSNKVFIETKGTANDSSISGMLNDIKQKKDNTKGANVKLGTLTVARKKDDKNSSRIIVCDDFNHKRRKSDSHINSVLSHYLLFLSFILDSHQYNILKSKIYKDGHRKNLINKKMISCCYIYNGVHYLGRCFDKRLILDYIADYYNLIENAGYYNLRENIKTLFQKLTNGIGLNKYFIGIDAKIIDAINRYDSAFFYHNEFDKKVIIQNKSYLVSDVDGVLFAASFDGFGDAQIEKMLPEEEVYERLELIVSYIDNRPHECGAPCISKGIEGKPCEKLTFREHCYFHRK